MVEEFSVEIDTDLKIAAAIVFLFIQLATAVYIFFKADPNRSHLFLQRFNSLYQRQKFEGESIDVFIKKMLQKALAHQALGGADNDARKSLPFVPFWVGLTQQQADPDISRPYLQLSRQTYANPKQKQPSVSLLARNNAWLLALIVGFVIITIYYENSILLQVHILYSKITPMLSDVKRFTVHQLQTVFAWLVYWIGG